jgi:hypothetical protein
MRAGKGYQLDVAKGKLDAVSRVEPGPVGEQKEQCLGLARRRTPVRLIKVRLLVPESAQKVACV